MNKAHDLGFPSRSDDKESACNARDPGSIPGFAKICWRRDRLPTPVFLGFPGGSDGKEPACNTGDLGLIPGLGRSAGAGNGNSLSILAWRIPRDREKTGGLHGVTEWDMTNQLTHTHTEKYLLNE